MAEFVELRTEEWATELEQLEKLGLFDAKEVKAITVKRRKLEYKVQRRSKTKEVFLNYIQFEIDFLRLIKFRRDKKKIYTHVSMIEDLQARRIVKLFKQVVLRNQRDIKLWMTFFRYCAETNQLKSGSQMVVRMLQIHPDQEKLWSFASKWGYETLKSVETARQFVLKGLRHHPTSRLLYTELFKLELNYATEKRREFEDEFFSGDKSDQKNFEEVINLKLVQVVYENSVTKIKYASFKVSLLNIATEYPHTQDLQNRILEDLMKEHENEEVIWDVIARRKYRGIHSEDPNPGIPESPVKEGENSEEKLKEARDKANIMAAVKTYQTAVQKLNTMKMWSLYLDFGFEIRKKTCSTTSFRKTVLLKALEDAIAAGRIEEKYILQWADLPQNEMPNKQCKMLKMATEKYPDSINLWLARLKNLLLRDKEELGMEVFKEATAKITGMESFPIWKLMIHYLQTKSNVKLEELFQVGIAQGGPLALCLKPMYLRWLGLTKGCGVAKMAFETPEMHHPPCLEVVNEMIKLELMQPEVNRKFIRRCHEMACNLAGKDNLDVWISYIEFELNYGDGEGPFIIYMRAVKTLCAELVQEFVSRYNALKMGS